MRNLALTPNQLLPVAAALLRGAAEFASLQRWRIRSWFAR
jgi:hypothetical protein